MMKTSKEKSKQKKTTGEKEPLKGKKAKIIKHEPTEEQIREKAMEIYQLRINRGKYGTAENDWLEAEKLLRDSQG